MYNKVYMCIYHFVDIYACTCIYVYETMCYCMCIYQRLKLTLE